MALRPFKWVVNAVLLNEEDGRVVGEVVAEPFVAYNLEQLVEYTERFPAELDKLNGSAPAEPS